MLEMRPDCERCGRDLPADVHGAFICSFECTFCADCADKLDERCPNCGGDLLDRRSEEHTSELQSLMRISYAVFCLKKNIEQPNKSRATTEQDTKKQTTTLIQLT